MFRLFLAVAVSVAMLPEAPHAGTGMPNWHGIILVQAANAEAKLRSAIDTLRSDSPNMNLFEPMLRITIRQQKEQIKYFLTRMGAVGAPFTGLRLSTVRRVGGSSLQPTELSLD
jgi:hypothetical protein